MWPCIIAFALILHPFTYLHQKRSYVYLIFRIDGHMTPCYVLMGMVIFCFCLFKRLLQTHGPYKIASNIKKKHCVNTINKIGM